VLGRAEIAEHVWDENFDPLSNLIDVNINRLRRKIDDRFSSPLIHTRRGEGYMLAAPDNSQSADIPDESGGGGASEGDHV
jgi:two-component system copper resistance phosphate regulon response regulator CusR